MKKILILKNIDREGPGLIASWFDKNDYDYDIKEVTDELLYQEYLDKYDGLVVLGGPASANDKTFIVLKQLEFIKTWIDSKKPYLGVCLGMQMMMKAMGAEVFFNDCQEIGFYHLENARKPYVITLEDAENNPLTSILPESFEVFQLHGETVSHTDIPSLGKTDWCSYQICSAGEKQYGVQFHLELSEGMLRNWILNDDFLVFADKEKYVSWYRSHQTDFEKNCFSLMRFIFG